MDTTIDKIFLGTGNLPLYYRGRDANFADCIIV